MYNKMPKTIEERMMSLEEKHSSIIDILTDLKKKIDGAFELKVQTEVQEIKIEQIEKELTSLQNSRKWFVGIVVSAVIIGVLKLVIIG